MAPNPLSALLAASRRKRPIGPIGFELGSDRLHLLQIEQSGGETRVRAAASVPRPVADDPVLDSPEALRALVREGLKRGPFRGRRIVTAAPAEALRLMVLNFESATDEPEPETILRLVQERIGESPEQFVVDYLSIRTSGYDRGARSALVAAARRDAVIRYLERLRAVGLDVEALEIVPVAVRRLVSRLASRDERENVLTIHCHHTGGDLTALCGRRMIFYRETDFGESPALEQVCKSLDLDLDSATSVIQRYGVLPGAAPAADHADPARALEISATLAEILKPSLYALAEEIDRAIVYTASQTRGASMEQVYVLGGIARWPGFAPLLESVLSLPVRIADPLAAFSPMREGSGIAVGDACGGMALAAGFALRGTSSDG